MMASLRESIQSRNAWSYQNSKFTNLCGDMIHVQTARFGQKSTWYPSRFITVAAEPVAGLEHESPNTGGFDLPMPATSAIPKLLQAKYDFKCLSSQRRPDHPPTPSSSRGASRSCHRSRTNPFNLIDDLIESFRPVVDRMARALAMTEERVELDVEDRLHMAGILGENISISEDRKTMLAATEAAVASLVRAIDGGVLPPANWQGTSAAIPVRRRRADNGGQQMVSSICFVP
jgi:hypothetical protein